MDVALDEDHVEGRRDGEQGHLVALEVAVRSMYEEVHQAVLERPDQRQLGGPRRPRLSLRFGREGERGDDERGQPKASCREQRRVDIHRADERKGHRPEQRCEKEEGQGEARSGPSRPAVLRAAELRILDVAAKLALSRRTGQMRIEQGDSQDD